MFQVRRERALRARLSGGVPVVLRIPRVHTLQVAVINDQDLKMRMRTSHGRVDGTTVWANSHTLHLACKSRAV